MTDRTYTVKEIDALRQVLGTRYVCGTTARTPDAPTSYWHDPKRMAQVVEDQLRTYMVAGITAEAIIAEDLARAEARP